VDAQASVPLELPLCDVEEKTITQDGLEVKLNIVRPVGSKAVLPGFVFVHGGGWILGDFPTHEPKSTARVWPLWATVSVET
jgi:acetyl esterase